MNIPEIVLFGNKYYCREYIADYKEQALLLCIVCNWCAKCLAHRDNLNKDALSRTKQVWYSEHGR